MSSAAVKTGCVARPRRRRELRFGDLGKPAWIARRTSAASTKDFESAVSATSWARSGSALAEGLVIEMLHGRRVDGRGRPVGFDRLQKFGRIGTSIGEAQLMAQFVQTLDMPRDRRHVAERPSVNSAARSDCRPDRRRSRIDTRTPAAPRSTPHCSLPARLRSRWSLGCAFQITLRDDGARSAPRPPHPVDGSGSRRSPGADEQHRASAFSASISAAVRRGSSRRDRRAPSLACFLITLRRLASVDAR